MLDVAIGQDRDLLLHADGAGKAHRRPGHFFDYFRRGQLDLLRLGRAANLAFVRLMIAADQDGDRLSVGQIDQRLDKFARLALQERTDLLDRANAGRGDLPQRRSGTSGGTQSRAPTSAFSWLAA